MNVPGLPPVARTGKIAGHTALRALQICVGLQDWSTPEAASTITRRDLEPAYDDCHKLALHIEPDTDLVETPNMRKAVMDFLLRELIW